MQRINFFKILGTLVFTSLFCFMSYSYAEDIMAYLVSNTAGIQVILKDSALYKGSIDGIHGSKTQQAIKEFQKEKGLKPGWNCRKKNPGESKEVFIRKK